MCQLCSQDLGQITYPQQSCSPGWRLAPPCREATWPSGPASNPEGLIKGSALNGPSFLLRCRWGWGWEREGETHKTSIIPEGGCDRYKLCFPIKTRRLCVQCTWTLAMSQRNQTQTWGWGMSLGRSCLVNGNQPLRGWRSLL